MSAVLLSDKLAKQLVNADSPIQMITTDGTLLGYFTPTTPRQMFDIDEAELDRRHELGGGRPLAEILADLEKRS